VFKIIQYSEMECNCARKITEGLLREFKALWQHMYESLLFDPTWNWTNNLQAKMSLKIPKERG